MQRLITRQAIDQKGARYVIDALWRLMETETEEVKVLQTVILLLTTNNIVQGETLSKVKFRFRIVNIQKSLLNQRFFVCNRLW